MIRLNTIALIAFCAVLHAGENSIPRALDEKLTTAQRNDACFELRGDRSTEALRTMRFLLINANLRACAARNLTEVGATEELANALSDNEPDVRAAAAGALGKLARPESIDSLARSAHDANLMVAASAVNALCAYEDRLVIPHLTDLAKSGSMVGMLALGRLAELRDPAALRIARELLTYTEVAVRLAAMRVIGDMGDRSDIHALKQMAGVSEELSSRARGFGLMPPVDLSRAAEAAIKSIERRSR
jgi:HEAT repeat protein